MRQKDKEKRLEVYFENHGKNFTIREISLRTKIPRATIPNSVIEIKERRLGNWTN